jgi:PAS domain-containing protein
MEIQDYLIKGQINRDLLSRSIRYSIERKRAVLELEEREARLQFVAEHSPDTIFIQDSDLRYIWVAQSLLRQEYVGKTDLRCWRP